MKPEHHAKAIAARLIQDYGLRRSEALFIAGRYVSSNLDPRVLEGLLERNNPP